MYIAFNGSVSLNNPWLTQQVRMRAEILRSNNHSKDIDIAGPWITLLMAKGQSIKLPGSLLEI